MNKEKCIKLGTVIGIGGLAILAGGSSCKIGNFEFGFIGNSPASKTSTAALKSGEGWVLQNPDGNKTEVKTLPEGFTPDKNLTFATDIKPLEIGSDLKGYSDWERALNTERPAGALAGYNYDYNDFCPTADFKCNVQGDMYGWRTFQGEMVEVPGIGKLEGGPGRSVVLNVLNLDASVYAWDNDHKGQVTVKRGFTATGRIFDGEKNVDVLERNLSGHWLFRQFNGTPEKSYIGITDSPDNAKETLLVSVQRKQWGLKDGSKRMEFQLMRAELVKSGQTTAAIKGLFNNPVTTAEGTFTVIPVVPTAAKPAVKQAAEATFTSTPVVAVKEQATLTSVPANKIVDRKIKPGETITVDKGSLVIGDVEVDGKPYYDSNEKTGEAIIFTENAKVKTQWGADLFYANINADAEYKRLIAEMKAKGCVNGLGCERFDVIVYPGGQPQGK